MSRTALLSVSPAPAVPASDPDPAFIDDLLVRGQFRAARQQLRRAMRRAPANLALRHLFARLLLHEQRPDLACEALAAAVAIAPRDARTRYHLGLARFADARPRDALAALLRACRLNPTCSAAFIEAAHLLILLHRQDDADRLLARARQRRPGDIAFERAIDAARNPAPAPSLPANHDEAAIDRLEQQARRITITRLRGDPTPESPNEAITAWFALARQHFRTGAGQRAFHALAQGHSLLARAEPFSPRAHQRLVADLISHFTAETLARTTSRADPTPVFIVGLPRSGTTLAEQILAAHHAVFGAGERSAVSTLVQHFGGIGSTEQIAALARRPARDFEPCADRFLAALHALAPGAARIIDKMPGNDRYVGLIARLLPNARFIHCIRDPRDIGLSIYSRRFAAPHPYAHDLATLGAYIRQQNILMAHWHSIIPDRILRVRLPEWIHDFDRALQRTLTFLDLPPDPACHEFYRLDREIRTASQFQVRQPINANGLGRWRLFEPYLIPLITALNTQP